MISFISRYAKILKEKKNPPYKACNDEHLLLGVQNLNVIA